MNISYSDHAIKRMKQRGITELEVIHALEHAIYIKKSFDGTKEAVGEVRNRKIKVVFTETENYIRIVTIV